MAFHLGFITSFETPAWSLARTDRLNGGDWWNGEFFADLAQRLEQCSVDYIFFADTLGVTRAINNSWDWELKYALTAPQHDPLPLLAKMAARTSKIGLIATASTTLYPPYLLARSLSTLDSLSNGRIGWNMVTTGQEAAVQAFGLDALPPHGERYAMADEFVELVKLLWNSWDADALVRDFKTDTHVDPSKVHDVDFKGKYYKCKGPLNTLRSPQTVPVLAQAGTSEAGRAFAARHADLVFTTGQTGVAAMREFRKDIRARVAKAGRNPDDVKTIFSATINFAPPGETSKTWKPPLPTLAQQAFSIGQRSTSANIDLTRYPLDGPVPQDLETDAFKGMLEQLKELGRQGMTLGEAATALWSGKGTDLNGSPEEIADKLIQIMDEVGGDGIMINGAKVSSGEYLDNVTQRLIPALQERGAVRVGYSPGTLRDRLRAI